MICTFKKKRFHFLPVSLNRKFSAPLIVGILGIFLSAQPAFSNEKCLSLIAQDNQFMRKMSDNVSAALNNSSICHSTFYFPPKRGYEMFRKKDYDGFIGGYDDHQLQSNPLLVKIQPALHESKAYLVTRLENIQKLSDLKDNAVGIVRGWSWMEDITIHNSNTIAASSLENLLIMFHKKHLDSILFPTSEIEETDLGKYSNVFLRKFGLYMILKNPAPQRLQKISSAFEKHIKNGEVFSPMAKKKH